MVQIGPGPVFLESTTWSDERDETREPQRVIQDTDARLDSNYEVAHLVPCPLTVLVCISTEGSCRFSGELAQIFCWTLRDADERVADRKPTMVLPDPSATRWPKKN